MPMTIWILLSRWSYRIARFTVAVALTASVANYTYAQSKANGSITGSVVDAESGEPIIGASVIVEGTKVGTATDLRGKFRIPALEPGTYALTVSAISYSRQRITEVAVHESEVTTLQILLIPEAIKTEEVVVKADALTSYEASLLAIQRKAPLISDGISAEQMKRSPDATSSEALRRLTGVSVVDNKFLYVRGTSERYSRALLNGAPLSSTEPDKKAFAFDLLPANLLENIVVTKSFAPDVSGDFTGGLLRINTIDFPSDLTVNISISSSYSTASTFKSFKSYQGGSTDFLAIDDGTRSLPSAVPENLRANDYTPEEILGFARMMKNIWSPVTRTASPNTSFSLSVGDGPRILNQNFGFVAGISYKRSLENTAMERNEYEANREPRFAFKGTQSTYSVLWGGLFNLSQKLSEFHKLSLKNTYSRTADDEVTELSGAQYTDAGSEQRQTALRFVSRSVYSGQLLGDHYLPTLHGLRLEWLASYSFSTRDEPDYRRVVYARELGSSDPFTAVLGFQANLKNGGRFYSDLAEKTRGLAMDLSMPLAKAKLKLGGSLEKRERDFASRLIGMIINAPGNGFTDYALYTLPLESIFAPENFRRNGFSIDEYENGTNNYWAWQTVSAAYLMIDLPLAITRNKLRLIGGARLEHSIQRVKSLDVSGQKEIWIELKKTDRLPSLNLVYSLSPSSNLRMAYTRTLNRPELRELAPFAYYDFNTQTSIRGNEHLQRALIENYDLRYEVYPDIGEILSASFFYKRFRNAIEQVVVSGSALGSERTFANADRAENYGWELEVRFSLKHIARTLSNFMLRANYAQIESRVYVSGTETTIERTGRPLQGQSPYMINAGITFTEPTLETSVNLLYNRFGRRIIEVATAYQDDVIEQPRDVIDLTITQPFLKHYEVKFSVKDLLSQEQVFTQGGQRARVNSRGSVYSLGIGYKL